MAADTNTLTALAQQVDAQRVLDRLDALAKIGGVPGGGVTRLAFSDEERVATTLVAAWMREAGLTVVSDSFGNLFGTSDRNAPHVSVSMAGSHLDTVHNGGRFDGALGVVAALEAVQAMQAADCLPSRPLEVVAWRCEEPVRFSHGKVGSLIFTGALTAAQLQSIEQPPLDLEAALRRDVKRPLRAASRDVSTYLELHIEQGRRLERAGRRIGVVTAVAAPIRLRITVQGRADHSGATPMGERHDALCAAAELVLEIERCARAEVTYASVATAAQLVCRPGTINVIPGQATLLVDVRGIDTCSMERIVVGIATAGRTVGARRGVAVAVETLSRDTPIRFSQHMIDDLLAAVRALGEEPFVLPSGAGHDAQCLAAIADAGMLFVPSVSGISHAPEEWTYPADIAAGTRALAACWWLAANRDGSDGSK